jgi:hypothetical protein
MVRSENIPDMHFAVIQLFLHVVIEAARLATTWEFTYGAIITGRGERRAPSCCSGKGNNLKSIEGIKLLVQNYVGTARGDTNPCHSGLSLKVRSSADSEQTELPTTGLLGIVDLYP